jgi:hypothetical protein
LIALFGCGCGLVHRVRGAFRCVIASRGIAVRITGATVVTGGLAFTRFVPYAPAGLTLITVLVVLALIVAHRMPSQMR